MTDFDAWLEDNGPDEGDFEEAYCLYRALEEGGDWGRYAGSSNDKGHKFIKGDEGPALALLSEKAIYAFRQLIIERYMDGTGPESMNPEGWYQYKRAMAKDD